MESMIVNIIRENPVKIILSNPRPAAGFQKIVVTRQRGYYLLEKHNARQITHERLTSCETGGCGGPEDTLIKYLTDALNSRYKQLNAWTAENQYTLLVSKKGKTSLVTNKNTELNGETHTKNTSTPSSENPHNREKNYLLREGDIIPPLVDMGVMTADGKVVAAMRNKYRQINRFLELIADAVGSEGTADISDETGLSDTINPSNRLGRDAFNIVDFGCGKSYLTFIVYYYLAKIRNMRVTMTGLDLKADVISQCTSAAQKYGYDGLHFLQGDIGGFIEDRPIDMVMTLHACDTATDHALYHAVRGQAKMIFSVPCCQHELNGQMKTDNLSILTRYGIVQERTAALMTDAVRANLLTACGYKTQLMEFVELTHTPKNLLIRAVKTYMPPDVRRRALDEVETLCRTFGFAPCLYELLQPIIKLP